jgi:hypothetical protein
MSVADYRRLTNHTFHPDNKSKFHAVRVVDGDENFDSRGEHQRYGELQWQEKVREIADLKRQVRIPLTCNGEPLIATNAKTGRRYAVVYVADFTYFDCDTRQQIIEDFKGFDTQNSRLKRAILATMPAYRDARIVVTEAPQRTPRRRNRR